MTLPTPLRRFMERYEIATLEFAGRDGHVPLRMRVAEHVARRLREVDVRARALPEVLAQRCEEEFGPRPSALRMAYTGKTVLCLLFARQGFPRGLWLDGVDVASYDHRTVYGGWEETYVRVASPWWRNFHFEIGTDGDSSL